MCIPCDKTIIFTLWPWSVTYFWKTLTLSAIYWWLPPGERPCLLTTLILSYHVKSLLTENSVNAHAYSIYVACIEVLLIWVSKGQGHDGAFAIEIGSQTITDFVIHLLSWNFIHLLLVNQGYALLILTAKGLGYRALMIKNSYWTITDYVIHLWNFIHLLPMRHGYALLIWGQKVTVQGHVVLVIENGFLTINDYVINLWSWNIIHLLPMCPGCNLLIFG